MSTPDDPVCEHGTALDVHCCGCHSGFLFDSSQCECLVDEFLNAPCGRCGSPECFGGCEVDDEHP